MSELPPFEAAPASSDAASSDLASSDLASSDLASSVLQAARSWLAAGDSAHPVDEVRLWVSPKDTETKYYLRAATLDDLRAAAVAVDYRLVSLPDFEDLVEPGLATAKAAAALPPGSKAGLMAKIGELRDQVAALEADRAQLDAELGRSQHLLHEAQTARNVTRSMMMVHRVACQQMRRFITAWLPAVSMLALDKRAGGSAKRARKRLKKVRAQWPPGAARKLLVDYDRDAQRKPS